MLFRRSASAPLSVSITTKPNATAVAAKTTTKQQGDAAEDLALDYLQKAGLRLLARNFKTPGRGGEVDLIMRAPDGTLVFVEVRQRKSASHGGAAASVSSHKQRRIVLAARFYLARLPKLPPCRFDVLSIDGVGEAQRIEWLQAAFDAS